MKLVELVEMIKIEVVVRGDDAASVEGLFSAADARGFTSVTGVSGLGHDGYTTGRLLFNDQAPLTMLLTVVPEDRADGLVDALSTLLAERSGVFFVTRVSVSRPNYFS